MDRIISALFGGGNYSEGSRETYPVIVLNNPEVNQEKDFPRNEIWTTKYTFITFLPKVLFEQFRKFTSLYFLLVCFICFFPAISPINPWSSVSGLLFILGVSMIREAVEDFFRFQADHQANRRRYDVVLPGSGDKKSKQSQHLSVGDLLYLTANEPVPADVVVLATGLDDSVCYIETAQLDGETNLKLRRGSSATMGLTIVEIADIDGTLECGVPVHELYKFKGSLDVKSLGRSSASSNSRGVATDSEWERRKTELGKSSDDERFASARLLALPPSPSLIRRGDGDHHEDEIVEIESDPIPKDSMLSRFRVPSVIGLDLGGTKRVSGPMMCSLGEDNMLPRGSVLRNTPWVLGIVAYAGFETKMSLNTKTPPSKFSSLDKRINKYVFFIFIFQLVLISICAIWAGFFEANANANLWYLDLSSDGSAFFTGVRSFFSYFILMSYLIPISLVVTLEVTKVVQGRFMEWDDELKYEGERMTVKTSNLNDELGLVQYVFSDKTGTLTQNQMDFKKVSVKGHILDDATNDRLFQAYKYAQSDEEAQSTYDVLLCLAICHSVVPEKAPDGTLLYKAASPDEEALCRGARDNRFRFLHRDSSGIDLEIDGESSHYEVLCTMPFTSERRRMSVIVRLPNGVIRLYSKGADATVIARLSKSESRELVAATEKNLELFSQDGLRTLVLASKDISKQDFKVFSDKYFVASNDMGDREGKIEAVCDEIEKDLFIVGSTAIEDKLQEYVPETIDYLLRAGIRVWVITGDKQATAINIGYSTQLLTKETHLYKLNANSPNSLENLLIEYLEETRQQSGSYQLGKGERSIWSMVIDGETLQYGLDNCPELLLEFAKSCHSVICCRVAPLQKAAVVKLVKDSLDCCTLSIGDGGNDVSMIQEANIGVGIYGKEGSQAARSSDYAIHRFYHLQRLLTVHGRYSLVRNALLTHYSFYKNATIFLVQIWFAFFCGCTGQSLYDDWIMTFFNIYITALPPFILGVFEIDISDKLIQKHPKAFLRTQTNQIFTLFTLMIWLSSSLYHSLVLFFGAMLLFHDPQLGNGQDTSSLSMMGMWVIITGIVVIFSKLFFEVNWWTPPMHAAVWISVAFFAFTVFVENSIPTLFPSQYYVLFKTFQSLSFWFWMIITVAICLLPDFIAKYVQRQYFPQDWQLLQESEVLEYEYRKREKKRQRLEGNSESQSLMSKGSRSYGGAESKSENLL